eukprot:Amastigsp_a175642_15.p2 type:complete len:101 gc:universal Amastigsp_a175642_15:325-23(-)
MDDHGNKRHKGTHEREHTHGEEKAPNVQKVFVARRVKIERKRGTAALNDNSVVVKFAQCGARAGRRLRLVIWASKATNRHAEADEAQHGTDKKQNVHGAS